MEAVKRSSSDRRHSMKKSGKTSVKSLTKAHKKSKKKDKKRKHSSYSYDSEDEPPRKKSKSKHKKKCKKRHRHGKEKKDKLKEKIIKKHKARKEVEPDIGPEVPANILDKAQSMAPMSKEEWTKRQMNIRRVYDEETGRSRLIRGDREIIEEIVSRDRHQEINRQATQADGHFFQSKIKKRIS